MHPNDHLLKHPGLLSPTWSPARDPGRSAGPCGPTGHAYGLAIPPGHLMHDSTQRRAALGVLKPICRRLGQLFSAPTPGFGVGRGGDPHGAAFPGVSVSVPASEEPKCPGGGQLAGHHPATHLLAVHTQRSFRFRGGPGFGPLPSPLAQQGTEKDSEAGGEPKGGTLPLSGAQVSRRVRT